MDALALLCTLYAEGPLTLARLRHAGCPTLDRVVAMDPAQLGALLQVSDTTAQRFQREARTLGERVGPEIAAPGAIANSRSTAVSGSLQRPAVLDHVLSTWRERDERETEDDAQERIEVLQPLRPVRGVLQRIPPAALDGLDADAAESLAQAGVRDLRSLAACDALAIARSSGLSYSRIVRLRALANRAKGIHVEPVRETSETKLSPSERPVVARAALASFEREPELLPLAHAEGAGGPFA